MRTIVSGCPRFLSFRNLDMLCCNLALEILLQDSFFCKVYLSDANTTKKELTNYENNDTYKKQEQIFPGT